MLSSFFRRVDPFAVLAVILPLLIYLLTLAPSVTFFDSGEFLTAIHSLGIAHSPGYPLFINYAKPFTWLPFGNIALRANMATAVSASAACFGVYFITRYLLSHEAETSGKPRSSYLLGGCSLAAALTFAFSARLWLQSNHDKPYPLVSFMAAVVFYLLLRWRERFDRGEECPHYVYLGAFICGLATGAHQTIVLLLPAYGWLILSKQWRLIGRVKEIIIAIAFGIFGFAIQLHLPLRAIRSPLLNWGDPKTLDQFLWDLLRKGYPSEPPVRDLPLLWQQLAAFNIPREFTWAGLVLFLIGAFVSLKSRRDEVLAYLFGVVCSLLVIVGYFNAPTDMIFLTEEFFTPLYLLTAVFVGLGLHWLLSKGMAGIVREKLASLPVKILVAVFLLVLPSAICALNYYENDQSENYVAFDYASNTFRSLQQGSVLFTWGDSGAFPLWYLQGAERMREDLDLLHTPHLVFGWYLDAFPHLFGRSLLRSVPADSLAADAALKLAIAEQIDRRPVFVDFSTRYSMPFTEYGLKQRGICYQLVKGGASSLIPPDNGVWGMYSVRGYTSQMGFRDLDTGKAILIYASSRIEGGETLLRLGRGEEGVAELREAATISPELAPQVSQLLATYGIR
ncbi:glycosyltransferase family 117 protein [Geobacter pickeringii]|uniref:Membrane protein n=1 Tax=Geobacter pickeringii TaxID=345632 RepID=A0A0B5B9M5_9BACT|nr:DUF2723 domain-containing protein [Geobacter pickeringii]AJE03408.1 membrane protein [Geobacter pickeringii]